MRKTFHLFYILKLIVVFCHPTQVSALSIDTNLFYLSDALTNSTESSSTRMLGDIAIMIDLDRKGYWVVGWSYNYISISETATTDTEFGLTEMGPRFGYYIDKEKVWSLFLTYCFQTTVDYSAGGSSEEWRGTSLKGELGFTPMFSESYHAGVKLIYYQATFDERFISGSFSTISNKRTLMYPALSFIYRFQ